MHNDPDFFPFRSVPFSTVDEPDLEFPRIDAPTAAPDVTPRSRWTRPGTAFVVVSILLHLILMFMLVIFVPPNRPFVMPPSSVMEVTEITEEQLAELEAAPSEVGKEKIPTPPSVVQGQIVNLPPPDVPQPPPDNARYIAAHDHRVLEEMQSERSLRRQEIPSSTFINHDKVASKRILKLQTKIASKSTLQDTSKDTYGDHHLPPLPAPDVPIPPDSGSESASILPKINLFPTFTQMLAINRSLRTPSPSFPSPRAESESGLASQSPGAGAPDTNYLRVPIGDLTALNARSSPFHAYLNSLRNQFDFYYTQTADNLSYREIRTPVRNQDYVTTFVVTFGADGRMTDFRVVSSSGVTAFDNLIRRALVLGSPFPVPPQAILDARGELTLTGECHLGVGLQMPDFR